MATNTLQQQWPRWTEALSTALEALRLMGQALTRLPSAAAGPRNDVERVRRLALTYMEFNPRYAADLFAAADRHEATQHPRG